MYDSRFNPSFQYQQPFQQTMQRIQQMELVRVNGIDGARAFSMPPNSTAALFDSGNDIMYIKQTDGAGFPSIRTFAFSQQLPQQNTAQLNQNVTREQIDSLKQMISRMSQDLKHTQSPVTRDEFDGLKHDINCIADSMKQVQLPMTRDEFDELKQTIAKIAEDMKHAQQPVYTKK